VVTGVALALLATLSLVELPSGGLAWPAAPHAGDFQLGEAQLLSRRLP
jgi:hypothetical protein